MGVEQMQGLNIGNLLQGITGVTDLVTDKKTRVRSSGSTSTQTSGLDISQAGRNKMIEDALASNNGLAETSSGQRRAGLYNSSTNQLLVNDLLDRVTSSVDRDTAKQTTSTTTGGSTQSTVTPARVGLGGAAGVIGGAAAAKKLYDVFSDGGSILNAGGGAIEALPDFVESFSGVGELADLGGLGAAAGGFPVVGTALKFLSGEPEDALASGLGFLAGNALLPGAGGIIGSVLSDIIPVGDILGGLGDALGGLFGGSVVCTELHAQGMMSRQLYYNDSQFAATKVHPQVLQGYRFWGVPTVKLMRRSKLVTHIAAFFAVNRAHYIAAKYAKETISYSPTRAAIGAVINTVGVPICYLIGSLLTARVSYNQLYSTTHNTSSTTATTSPVPVL